MNFSLIICTYLRPASLKRLMDSVLLQTFYPNTVIVVDGSTDELTREILGNKKYPNLKYYKVKETDRGLTRQRNFGIARLTPETDIVCFLDDDIVLEIDYFEKLIQTYRTYPQAMGVGGSIVSKDTWRKHKKDETPHFGQYAMEGFVRDLGARNVLRKRLGLLSDENPGIMPGFSHGFSIGFLPPSGKIYPVEFFMGGVASYKTGLFEKIQFSEYFIGYGLYEDMDFCLKASKIGQLYVNTAARCEHLHEEAGRPDKFKYGKMVVENGWVVWKEKYQDPDFKSVIKWNAITLLLAGIRIKNGILDKEKDAFNDALGRFAAWLKLGFKKPVKTD